MSHTTGPQHVHAHRRTLGGGWARPGSICWYCVFTGCCSSVVQVSTVIWGGFPLSFSLTFASFQLSASVPQVRGGTWAELPVVIACHPPSPPTTPALPSTYGPTRNPNLHKSKRTFQAAGKYVCTDAAGEPGSPAWCPSPHHSVPCFPRSAPHGDNQVSMPSGKPQVPLAPKSGLTLRGCPGQDSASSPTLNGIQPMLKPQLADLR